MLALPANAAPMVRTAHANLTQELARAKALGKLVKDKHEQITDQLWRSGLAMVAGAGAGWYQGRYGDTVRWGLPTTSWATLLTLGWGVVRLFRSGGAEGHTLLSAGLGVGIVALAGWFARKGHDERVRVETGAPPATTPTTPAAAAGADVGMRMNDAMLREYANSFT